MRMPPALAAAAIALAFPATGFAGDDENEENESTTRVSCLGGIAELRLEAERDEDDDERGGAIEIELRVNVRRPVPVWRLVLVHERRLLYLGARLSTRSGYALRYEREIPDWRGRQTVVARLSTPAGHVCRLEATI